MNPIPGRRDFRLTARSHMPTFVHNFFIKLIKWLAAEVHARIEYFVVNQRGEIGNDACVPFLRVTQRLIVASVFDLKVRTISQASDMGSSPIARSINLGGPARRHR